MLRPKRPGRYARSSMSRAEVQPNFRRSLQELPRISNIHFTPIDAIDVESDRRRGSIDNLADIGYQSRGNRPCSGIGDFLVRTGFSPSECRRGESYTIWV